MCSASRTTLASLSGAEDTLRATSKDPLALLAALPVDRLLLPALELPEEAGKAVSR